ncbi:cyclin-A2-4 [Brassica rapa]|uniref:Cyclin N-terminal domain-containing protein n=1 Tax=Brassica campestris TaxID=3711 RepID=M4C9E3_BRACM|nr:cyclin-A2-4 [Brassica rapa]XP_009134346.1 cyclin-A2-4 [Brassica rapa]
MKKENDVSGSTIPLHARPLTRAYSKMITSSEVDATTQSLGHVARANTKRAALDEKKASAPKKRAVLKDITNEISPKLETVKQIEKVGAVSTVAKILKVIDIDSDEKDPLLCSLYAPEIYHNLRVAELQRRPFPDYMERIQRDLTWTMRGILVDWLVEVSEEYKLVPDTLYLTMYLIDWFLHGNYIERQRLQLLGVTCMFIASKYEEIFAPRIEEFCFITDNTYTKDQVLEMESQVLKHFGFQIYTPTSKTFLRRFLRAAHASDLQKPSVEMEFLANYLIELTLIDYEFLKFLPSVIAASAVFLAKWTLNQSSHPWNPTLEHYTTFKASDLKASVHALQDLQLNTKGCTLTSIRLKYKQEKLKSVAVLSSPELPDRLF